MSVKTIHITEHQSLKALNTFGVEAKARFFAEIGSIEQIQTLLSQQHHPKLILGGGSNILFTQDYEGLVIKNNILGIEKLAEDSQYVWLRVGAGENWHRFVTYCIKQNYAGVENLSLIPGTVGAAPIQNIGAYGVELKDVFTSLQTVRLNDASVTEFKADDCQFGYRDSIFKQSYKGQYVITHVCLQLNKKPEFNLSYGIIKSTLKAMQVDQLSLQAVSDAVIKIRCDKLPNPRDIGNAGSFFKNPILSPELFNDLQAQYPDMPNFSTHCKDIKIPAAWLIEQCNFKGKRVGNVAVYSRHALVLVNHGDGTGEDIKHLAENIRDTVYKTFSISLEYEVQII